MARTFHFKQFSLQFDLAAHPVGTDAVILGAFAAPHAQPSSILDLGTGCGIVALMLAQRFPHAQVTGIEQHKGSFQNAAHNTAHSPLHNRVRMLHQDLTTFRQPAFDLIVANPPFFTRQLEAPEAHRNAARHLPHGIQPWLNTVAANLSPTGTFWAITPLELHLEMVELLMEKGLHLRSKLTLRGTPKKEPIRVLAEWRHEQGPLDLEERSHRNEEGQWSTWYVEGTRGFYLNLR